MNNAVNNLFAQQAQAQQQTQYPADIANFNLIPATNKSSERSPDFFGSTKIGGAWYMLSAWIVFSRNGKQMINTAMRPATQQEATRQEAQQAQYAQNNPQQAQHTGGQQNPLDGFTGSPTQGMPQGQWQGAAQHPTQQPMQAQNGLQQPAQAVTGGFPQGGQAQGEQPQQAQAQQSQASSANPLEEDVVHVDIDKNPPF